MGLALFPEAPLPRLLPILLLALACGACRRDFSTEADRLRRQVLELEQEKETLTRRVEALETKLAQAASPPEGLSEEAAAALPVVAGIRIDRRSHLVDRDGDGHPDLVRVYVSPLDGDGRFVQLVGELAVAATLAPATGAPVTLAQRTLSPRALHDTYRTGMMGTHYAVECELQWPPSSGETPLTVAARFDDARSGRSFRDQRALSWPRR